MDSQVRLLLQQKNAIIMGIVNATPDSFSDGGQHNTVQSAVAHALLLLEQGAQIIDIGGESTRPGAASVSLEQELDRVIPIIKKLGEETDAPISIDTHKPDVMREAISAGAQMVNDVNALRTDGAVQAVAEMAVPVCLMHMRGDPQTMQTNPNYVDVLTDVSDFLQERIEQCVHAGIAMSDVIVDPGIGFGKTVQHNLLLLNQLPQLAQDLRCPVLIGVSRKSLIDKVLGRQVSQRAAASVGLAVQAVINGAKIVRVHDVQETSDAIRMVEAVENSNQ